MKTLILNIGFENNYQISNSKNGFKITQKFLSRKIGLKIQIFILNIGFENNFKICIPDIIKNLCLIKSNEEK